MVDTEVRTRALAAASAARFAGLFEAANALVELANKRELHLLEHAGGQELMSRWLETSPRRSSGC